MYIVSVKTNYKRFYDAVNACTEHAIAISNDYIACSDLDEIQEIIQITDKTAKITILESE